MRTTRARLRGTPALVISNGNASMGAAITNPTTNANMALGSTISDDDIQAVSAQTYAQTLFDVTRLQFDLTPRATGTVAFQ